jgi:peptide/nickel transport system substrate-binding protein
MRTPLDLPLETLLTRRTMLKAAAVGGIALLLDGCASAASSSSSNGAKARRSMTLGTVTDFAPTEILRAGVNTTTLSLIFDTLADVDLTTVQPTPMIATSWVWNSDKTELTVNLRDDVYFHSGRKLGPEDAIYSIKATQSSTAGAQIGGTTDLITAMRVTGPNQFKITVSEPISSFANVLVLTPLIDRKTFSGLASGKQVVGTGPFRFESWVPGSSISLRRNDRYWQHGLPRLDSVKVRVFGSEQSLVAAIRDNEIDLAWNLVPSDAALLKRGGKFASLTTGAAVSEWYVGVNVKSKPFDDVRIRQAIAYALDRERIVKQAFASYGAASCLPWSTSLPGVAAADATHYPYDPDKAKALLREAGASGVTAPILTNSTNTIAEAILNIVQYNLTAAGFKVKASQVQATTFQNQLQAASIDGLWINDVGQTYLSLGTVLLGNAPFKITKNTSNVTDPEYVSLAKRVIYASTAAQEASANRGLSAYVLDQAFHITVGSIPTVSAAATSLSGVQTSGGGAIELTGAKLT